MQVENAENHKPSVADVTGIKRILVTGGLGYIGSHTVVELIQQGFEPIIVDNLFNSNVACLTKIKQILNKDDIIFEELDINDFDALDKVFTQYKPQAVIHFAAFKAVGESVAKPLEYYRNNVGGVITLLRVIEKH